MERYAWVFSSFSKTAQHLGASQRPGSLMDIYAVIRELYAEKERLDRTIATLEELQDGAAVPARGGKRRGRKSMNAEERREVSERMKKYWALRRKS
jgi:hypothetical protein